MGKKSNSNKTALDFGGRGARDAPASDSSSCFGTIVPDYQPHYTGIGWALPGAGSTPMSQSASASTRRPDTLRKWASSLGADEHTEAKVEGGRRNRKVVGRDEAALSAERREQLSPALGDLATKLDSRHSRKEGIYLGTASRCAGWCVGQVDTDHEFRVDDSREDDGLVADGGKGLFPGSG